MLDEIVSLKQTVRESKPVIEVGRSPSNDPAMQAIADTAR